MAHEIESRDGLVLAGNRRAWHGLGTLVEECTPKEALQIAGLNWGVDQRPMFTVDDLGRYVAVEGHVANYRSDGALIGLETDGAETAQLGVVTDGYQPVSNQDMADFADALLADGQVQIETAGSIRSGQRTWFLLRGQEFAVQKNGGDSIFPYVLISNGHDGASSFRVTPTTVRAVCSNTLHQVIPRKDTGRLAQSAFVMRHTSNVMARVSEARSALANYGRSLAATKEVIQTLSSRPIESAQELQEFFVLCYQLDFAPIPANPANKREELARNRATKMASDFARNFEKEPGTSLWSCFNSYSELIQHRPGRGKNDVQREEKRIVSNLFGLNSERTSRAIDAAYSIATA